MSDDLVKKLLARKKNVYDAGTQGMEWCLDELCQAAAAEITRLRAALATARRDGRKEMWETMKTEMEDAISAAHAAFDETHRALMEVKP